MIALALLLATTPLDDAAAALAAGDAEVCAQNVKTALESGALDVPDVARAWMLRGKCFVLAGDVDRAERSYGVALRVQPVDDGQAPDDVAYAAALRALPSVPGLSARAAAIDDDTIEIELLGDDLLLVKGAVLVGTAVEEVARVPLEAGLARHKISGVGRTGLTAVLVDKHGNALLRLPVDPTVQRVFTPAPAATGTPGVARSVEPTVLTTLGATAIGAGVVGVVASGIGLASLGRGALDDAGVPWAVGVGASTALFLVGAGLVVVDQGL